MKRSRLSHFGASGSIAQRFAEEHGADFRAAERQAEMAGVTGVDGVHGEATGFVGGLSKQGRVHEIGIAEGFGLRSAQRLGILPLLTSRHSSRLMNRTNRFDSIFRFSTRGSPGSRDSRHTRPPQPLVDSSPEAMANSVAMRGNHATYFLGCALSGSWLSVFPAY